MGAIIFFVVVILFVCGCLTIGRNLGRTDGQRARAASKAATKEAATQARWNARRAAFTAEQDAKNK